MLKQPLASLVALSPGPFFADGIAIASKCQVQFYLKLKHVASGRTPEKTWTFTSPVDSLIFSPNGRKLALGMFKDESVLVISLETSVLIELSEPLAGCGMAGMMWPLDDWLITFSDFGLFMCMWHPSPTETEPDRVSKPNRNKDDLASFVVDFFSSRAEGDFIAMAHGQTDLSVFKSEMWERRWHPLAQWSLDNSQQGSIELIKFVDKARLLVLTDSLAEGQLCLRRVENGEVLQTFGSSIAMFEFDITSRRLVFWGMDCGIKGAVEKVSQDDFATVELSDPKARVLSAALSMDGHRVALLLQDPDGPDSGQCLVVRTNLALQASETSSNEVSLSVSALDFVAFKWDPTLRDRLLIVLRKMVILWRKGATPEIIDRVDAHKSDTEVVDALWNGIGTMAIILSSSGTREILPRLVDVID